MEVIYHLTFTNGMLVQIDADQYDYILKAIKVGRKVIEFWDYSHRITYQTSGDKILFLTVEG